MDTTDGLTQDDLRHRDPRFRGEHPERNRAPRLEARWLAGDCGVTRRQLALSWLLAQDGDVVPIPGTKRIERLEPSGRTARVVAASRYGGPDSRRSGGALSTSPARCCSEQRGSTRRLRR